MAWPRSAVFVNELSFLWTLVHEESAFKTHPSLRKYDVISPLHWNFASPHLAAIARRDWGFGPGRLRVSRLPRLRPSRPVAGAAARAAGEREFSVLLDLGLCRQSATGQSGTLGRARVDRALAAGRTNKQRRCDRL